MGYPTGHHGIVQESPVARLRRPIRYAMAGWPCRCGARIVVGIDPACEQSAAVAVCSGCGRYYTLMGPR